jgi:peptide/nickel transport system permease protein
MIAFLAKRIGIGAITLIVASMVVFGVLEILPGDPALLMLGMNATPEALASMREQMGLNEPVLVRYLGWIAGLLAGDFGRSFTYSSPVIDLIVERVVVSLPLALIALALSTAIAIPVGMFSGAAAPAIRCRWASPSSASQCRISGSRCCWSMSSPCGSGSCPPAAFPAGTPASGRD